MKVVSTEQAFARLAEIEAFVAADAPEAAEQLVARLADRGEGLARFPRSGRRVPELPVTDLREVIEGNYRLVYRVRGQIVEILTVFEGHRLFPDADLPASE